MNADVARVLLLALCCVGALVFAAGTIADPVDPDDEEGGGLVGGDHGEGAGDADDSGLPGPLGSSGLAVCLPILSHPLVSVGLLALWVGIAAVLVRKTGYLVGSIGAVALWFPGFVIYATVSTCGDGGGGGGTEEPVVGEEAANGTAEAGNVSGNASPLSEYADPSQLDWLIPFLLVIGALVIGAVAAREWRDEVEERPEADPGVTTAPAAIAREAGRAADRIESAADVDNEVYRAWAEMTRHVDVEGPETSTPGEFATAAVEAGLAPEHVEEVTDVFEEVRYGGAAPTPDLESRAVEALRRIESEYGDGDTGAGGDRSGDRERTEDEGGGGWR